MIHISEKNLREILSMFFKKEEIELLEKVIKFKSQQDDAIGKFEGGVTPNKGRVE